MKLTEHFPEEEAACPCGCKSEKQVRSQTIATAIDLERIRDVLQCAIVPTSWVRCEKHNAKVGGETNSFHTPKHGACAVDFKAGDYSGEFLAGVIFAMQRLGEISIGGIGTYKKYPNMVHFDRRGRYARWKQ